MALQASGQISLADLQAEYGGSHPIGMNEYYRGGSLVAGSGSSSQSYTPTYRASSGPNGYFWRTNSGFIEIRLGINFGTMDLGAVSSVSNNQSYSITANSVIDPNPDPANAGAHMLRLTGSSNMMNITQVSFTDLGGEDFVVNRVGGVQFTCCGLGNYHGMTHTIATLVNKNTNVPASGMLTFSNFYSGEA